MSSKKMRKGSAAPKASTKGPAATERARKAAIAEIQGRLKGKPAKPGSAKVAAKKALTTKKPGGLTAAYQVLSAAKQPMRCGDIVAESIKRGLWQTTGKTPQATIHAAMIREIAAKGKDARFRKVGRGLFAATKGG